MTDAKAISVSSLSQGQKTQERRDGKSPIVIDGVATLEDVVHSIRTSTKLAQQTVRLRELLAEGGRKGPYEKAKLDMPAIVPAMCAPKGTLLTEAVAPTWHNGLYGFDIDEHRQDLDIPAVRKALIEAPGAVMVGTSVAGDALYAVFKGPLAADKPDYVRHWCAIAAAMPEAAEAASGAASKNPNRLRFMAHDPAVWLAPESVTALAGAVELLPPAAPLATPLESEHDVDRSALFSFRPPDGGGDANYNSWLSWLRTLKALGFSAEEAERWSAQGGNHKQGEVLGRWDGLESSNTFAKERDKLRGHAYKQGWRKQSGIPVARPPEAAIPAAPAIPHAPPGRPEPQAAMLNKWFGFAEYWGREHGRGRYRYVTDPAAFGWWAYIDNVWRPLSSSDPRLHDELARYRYKYADELVGLGQSAVADELVQGGSFATMVSKGEKGDLLVGLREACAGEAPAPELYYIGTPTGIVDLRDGTLIPHAPEYGIRALTGGAFLEGADRDTLLAAVQRRFDPVFDREGQRQYIRLIALALTGMAQAHRAIVMVKRKSESGKGGACNVVLEALGEMGMGVGAEWIAQQQRSDIDAILAEALERQPRALHVDEIGGDTHIGVSRLNTLTGNVQRHARRPHGALLKGRLRFMIWTTCVDVPTIPRNSGIDRRLAVLSTKRKLKVGEKDEDGGSAPDLLNAVVTLACLQAREVYTKGYAPPDGSRLAKADALADMDRVAAWLEDQEDLDGLMVSEARKRACQDLEIEDRDLSATAFGSRLSSSVRWGPRRFHGGKRGIQQRSEPMGI